MYFRCVSCATGEGIKKLRTEIEEVILSQKQMGEAVPTGFLLLENLLQEEAKKRTPPIISRAELATFAARYIY